MRPNEASLGWTAGVRAIRGSYGDGGAEACHQTALLEEVVCRPSRQGTIPGEGLKDTALDCGPFVA